MRQQYGAGFSFQQGGGCAAGAFGGNSQRPPGLQHRQRLPKSGEVGFAAVEPDASRRHRKPAEEGVFKVFIGNQGGNIGTHRVDKQHRDIQPADVVGGDDHAPAGGQVFGADEGGAGQVTDEEGDCALQAAARRGLFGSLRRRMRGNVGVHAPNCITGG
ncbi:hypothetical protein AC812_05540 [Bellilinea caldifistulae]|uniref:Uncharacterized protein n=1 Tax=Bellilinea caldifistulae TaxID=360411 RepID=A0A0P6XTY3_9CHLR|nr:hypothetical protein AC812_05540 [Bellilinea caldifistulae]